MSEISILFDDEIGETIISIARSVCKERGSPSGLFERLICMLRNEMASGYFDGFIVVGSPLASNGILIRKNGYSCSWSNFMRLIMNEIIR
ncbi:MAG: hypothetical protein OXE56_05770 [Gammaproteobacteria bacterium]|nr:hypothetical protein [Gammaproteobacteria bacterium]